MPSRAFQLERADAHAPLYRLAPEAETGGNDPVAVAAAIDGSARPTRFIDPASIACSATYYAGSRDWIGTGA